MDELKNEQVHSEQGEVVEWYTPPRPQEVVGVYVHDLPLPHCVAPAAPAPRRRHGFRRFLLLLALLLVLMVASVFIAYHRLTAQDTPYDDGGDASSIINIFGGATTRIPRYDTYSDTRLTLRDENSPELTAREIYEKCNPSTVLVVAQDGSSASIGSGIIISDDGYILTNAHVLSGAESCWVALYDGHSYDCQLVGIDEREDVAVLRALEAEGLPAAEFGNSDLCRVGDRVYAIGNPLGVELRGTITDGILSALNRPVVLEGHTLTVLQTTAALNSGNSGGPLINRFGQVIGINTLKMDDDGSIGAATVEGLGFAIPISDASFIVHDIIATGSFSGRPMLGLSVITVNTEQGETAVMVVELDEQYGADDAGIAVGDVILAVNGEDIYTTEELLQHRRACRVGDVLCLTIYREGEIFDVDIELEAELPPEEVA